ncbi:hypothetical protein GF312_17100 [Candidatus Poribacteria bacterium]|nr:hypothetical protein [Candidatus Poribacteria bacterium]
MRFLRLLVPITFFIICVVFLVMLTPKFGLHTFKDDFNNSIKPNWLPKTPEKWKLTRDGKKIFYQLKEPGGPVEGISRPSEYSLVGNLVYNDFTMECKVRCDAHENLRYRDAVFIFGFQDDKHFYYVHLSNISDDLHNAIMLVNGEYRKKLNEENPEPTLTDRDFHKVKIKRKSSTGNTEVYFDGKMIMQMQDKTFISGKVGIGSFDDTASFDDFKVIGKLVDDKSEKEEQN